MCIHIYIYIYMYTYWPSSASTGTVWWRRPALHPVPITRFSLTNFVPRVGSEKFES